MGFLGRNFEKLFLDRIHTAILFAYACMLGVTVHFHEPWFDEAQAWLLARDLSLPRLVFHWLRYEGTPGLWHVLLFLAQRVGLPYAALGWFAAMFAIAGVYVVLRFSPFPLPIKAALPFSMFILYQYAAVARSYVLLPLLVFLAAYFIREGPARIGALTIALSLLAVVSAHGTALACGIAMAYAITLLPIWKTLAPAVRSLHCKWAAVFVAANVYVVALSYPARDCNFLTVRHPDTNVFFTAIQWAIAECFGVSFPLCLAFLVLLGAFAYHRRVLQYFVLPAAFVLALFGYVYVNYWHLGALFLSVIGALWIAWPTAEQQKLMAGTPKFLYHSVYTCVLALLCLHIWWGLKMVRYDIDNQYSGSAETARQLRSMEPQSHRMYAFGFSTAAILPFFKENIFANQRNAEQTSFWRWTKSNSIDRDFARVVVDRPDIVVFGIKGAPPERGSLEFLLSHGYVLTHSYKGALVWRGDALEPDSYAILELESSPQVQAASSGLKASTK